MIGTTRGSRRTIGINANRLIMGTCGNQGTIMSSGMRLTRLAWGSCLSIGSNWIRVNIWSMVVG